MITKKIGWIVNKICLGLLVTPYAFWIGHSKYNNAIQILMVIGVAIMFAGYAMTTD